MITREQIEKVIPHRGDMLLLDEIREFDDKSGTGVRHVRGDEFWCAGHFPSKPIMPGVLQVEALAQTAGFIVFENLRKTDAIPKLAYFTTMEKIRFSNMVHPGDTLELRVELIGRKMKLYKFRGVATVAGKKVCEAVFSAIMDDDVGAE